MNNDDKNDKNDKILYLFELMLKNGADINTKDQYGFILILISWL